MKTKILILITSLAMALTATAAEQQPQPQSTKLQDALAEAVHKSVEVAGEAKDFLAAEIPEVVRQLLLWKMAESIAYNVVGVVVIVLAIYGSRKLYRFVIPRMDEDYEIAIPVAIFGTVGLSGVFFYGIACFSLAWLQIWLAPKVYLIEYLRSMVK